MYNRYFRILVLAVVSIAFVFTSGAVFPGEDDDDSKDGVDVDPKRIDEAIDKAIAWVKGKQEADGSWSSDGLGHTKIFKMGYTALCTFALLKGGVKRNDPVINKAFAYLADAKLEQTYSVACYILALEARYAPPPPKPADKTKKKKSKMSTTPYEEQVKRNWVKGASPKDKRRMQELIDWMVSKQTDTVWRYPKEVTVIPANDTSPVDNSNTQYALLALNAGRRCNCKIPANVWIKTAKYFVAEQEKEGPKVKPFVVPAADWDISKLKKVQKKFLKKLQTARRKKEKEQARKKKDEKEEEKDKDKGPRTGTIDPEEFGLGVENREMFARGWSYTPKGKGGTPHGEQVIGSMTTSGVAALVICKAALEYYPGAWKGMKKKVNKGIRDGAAWLAHNFSATANPGLGSQHYYYYLYGLERAGVLSCCEMLGTHDWYTEGANAILGSQLADGSWPTDRFSGATANTCFCILFLKRATTPLIGNPNDRIIWTGTGLKKGK
ncbi:MAG: hypothetical protein E3J72_12440 [Planctomycetota bacterium]|nr:MAG: hypothetical protein E3J72_12440 [Planctomycetota bacterium]